MTQILIFNRKKSVFFHSSLLHTSTQQVSSTWLGIIKLSQTRNIRKTVKPLFIVPTWRTRKDQQKASNYTTNHQSIVTLAFEKSQGKPSPQGTKKNTKNKSSADKRVNHSSEKSRLIFAPPTNSRCCSPPIIIVIPWRDALARAERQLTRHFPAALQKF